MSLIVDFINIVNNIDFNNKGVDDDKTGDETIKILKNVKKIAYRLNANHSSSLGLHPIVYFYSEHISNFFQAVIVHLKSGNTIDDTVDEIISTPNFRHLSLRKIIQQTDSSAKDFNTNQKSEISNHSSL